MRVTFLTVGEYPTAGGLHASQVLPFAIYLQGRGVRVNWVAYVPLEMRLRDLMVNGGALLSDMKKLVGQHGIDFTIKLFPITVTRAYSYMFRNRLVRLAGINFSGLLRKYATEGDLHIIQCRSYFATAVALEAKKSDKNIRVSFDMRSLLPPELPLMFPLVGNFFYGGLKRWEAFLLKESDCSFLPSQRGIRRLELEGGEHLPTYVPIAGLVDSPASENHDDIFQKPVICYVGGIGPWHSIKVLELVFEELAKSIPGCAFEVLTSNAISLKSPVKVHSLPNHKIHEALKSMLAVVVPGPADCDNYFMRNVSTYLFSTKATEALSLGIPLIVNENNLELVEYVTSRQCGLVFSIKASNLIFEGVSDEQLAGMEFWANLRMAARQCASEFCRESVFGKYLKVWSEYDLVRTH